MPVLAFTKKNNPFIVKSHRHNSTEIIDVESLRTRVLTEHELRHKWDGKILLVDKENIIPQHAFFSKKKFRLKIALGILIVLFCLIMTRVRLHAGLLFLTNLSGLFIGILLMKKELISGVDFKICNAGDKLNCDSILSSKGSKLNSWLSMSDIVFLYFSFSTLLTIILFILDFSIADKICISLFCISFLSIPFTFYSFYYQGVILKKWCVLCLLTVLILWSQIFIGLFFIELFGVNFSLQITLALIALLLMYILTFDSLKIQVKRILNYGETEFSLARLLNNYGVFEHLLRKEIIIDPEFQNTEIVLGDKDAQNTLLLVLSPNCEYCAMEFLSLEEQLKKKQSELKIVLRFIDWKNENNSERSIISRLIQSYFHNDEITYLKILKDWFSKKELNDFEIGREFDNELNLVNDFFKTWSLKNRIDSVPMVFFNNHKLPQQYDIEKLFEMLNYHT